MTSGEFRSVKIWDSWVERFSLNPTHSSMAHLTKEGELPWHRLLPMMATNPTNDTQCSTSMATTMYYMDEPLMSYTAIDEKTIDQIQKLINSRGRRKTCISVMEEGVEIENVTEKMRGKRRRPGSHAVLRLRLNWQLSHTHTSMAHFTKEGEEEKSRVQSYFDFDLIQRVPGVPGVPGGQGPGRKRRGYWACWARYLTNNIMVATVLSHLGAAERFGVEGEVEKSVVPRRTSTST
jgi:hypothetical protein